MFDRFKKLFASTPSKPTAAQPAVNADQRSPSINRPGLFGTPLGHWGDQPGMKEPHMQSLLHQLDRSDEEDASKGCCFGGQRKG